MSSGRAGYPLALAVVAGAVALAVIFGWWWRGRDEGARCGPGFVARGARCVVVDAAPAATCPRPLAPTRLGCDAPDVRVLVPEATITVGPSDWEAEGRVRPRTVHAGPFRIDAFEVTRGRWAGADAGVLDPAQAASGMTYAEAQAFCARQAPEARLPTEDEWIVAAVAGAAVPARYPWGETGAVCRRAAWGLEHGPCATGARGPDTVGAHPDGDSPLGIHDLAGNVAEWVARASGGAAKGGSWASELAADLRVWAVLEAPPDGRDSRVGLRCVYPP